MSRKIAFLNQKGGVGKTTSTVNIASTMVKRFNRKVLVVDCDSQRNATNYLATYCPERPRYSIWDYFVNDVPIEDIIVQVHTTVKGKTVPVELYVLPSAYEISALKLPSVYSIKKMLEPLEDMFDYILFDLPPQFNGTSASALLNNDVGDIEDASVALSALVAANYVIVPAAPTRFSVEGFDDLLNSIKAVRQKQWNLDLYFLGIMFNNVISRRSLEKHITETSKEQGENIFKVQIKSYSDVEQAEYFGIPIAYFSGGSTPVAMDYMFLTQEIFKRIKEREGEA